MFQQYFYHEHTKRAVAVFGTLFNNIRVTKRDSSGKVLSTIKVPLSYGPRQKFLARINDERFLNDPKLAIRLPRMSFEIISIAYDTNTKLQKGTTRTISSSPTSRSTIMSPVTYRIGMQLNVLAKNQDDALQILEQILPYFQPEFNVTVKEIDGAFTHDMPFTLDAVTMSDDYEGDFLNRRAIIYTLEFETRVRYYGPTFNGSVIRQTETNFSPTGTVPYTQKITVTPTTAGPDDEYELVTTYTDTPPDTATITFSDVQGGPFQVGESVYGTVSGTAAAVLSVDGNTIVLGSLDGFFDLSDSIVGIVSEAVGTVLDIAYSESSINIMGSVPQPDYEFEDGTRRR